MSFNGSFSARSSRELESTQLLRGHAKVESSLLSDEANPPPAALTKRPWLLYTLTLLTLPIALVSFGFYATLNIRGNIQASRSLDEWVNRNRRLSAQVVAVLASLLTAAMKWGLSRAFTFTAQKRFSHRRTVFEAEFWSSLKNGGIVVPLSFAKSELLAFTATVVIVFLCGLMTAGFVSLLSPLPINLEEPIVGGVLKGRQIALLTSSVVPSCANWYYRRPAVGELVFCDGSWALEPFGKKEPGCAHKDIAMGALDAGRSSMLQYIFESTSAPDPRPFVTSLSDLGNLRILGSTGGVIPMGPRGIRSFALESSHLGNQTLDSRMNLTAITEYTLTQQAIFVETSCEYIDESALPYDWPPNSSQITVTPWRSSSHAFLSINCAEFPHSAYMRLGYESLLSTGCPEGPTTRFYLHSFDYDVYFASFKEPPYAYAGIDVMMCTATPKVGLAKVTYNATIDAFTVTQEGQLSDVPNLRNLSEPVPPLRDLTSQWYKMAPIKGYQTLDFGNLAGSLLNELTGQHYGLTKDRKTDLHPTLVAKMIKGIIEFRLTYLAISLELMNLKNPAPEECQFPITGKLVYPVNGWNAQPSTLLSLVPLALIGALTAVLILSVILHKEPLKLFDPTHPVSLITAASISGTPLRPEAFGDPADEEARKTWVKYGVVSEKSEILDQSDKELLVSSIGDVSAEQAERLFNNIEAVIRLKYPERSNIWGLHIERAD